jgi:hypothetical protein
MEPTDLTIEVLKGIRSSVDELRTEMRTDLEAVRTELHEGLASVRDELSRRIVDSEVRTSTAITELAGSVREMTGVLRVQHDLRPRVERCERDIDDLKRTVASR